MNYRRTRAVTVKELYHITRDPRSLGMALAIPVLMLVLFGYALSLDVDRVPALVLDRDGSARSRELIDRFRGSRYFDIRGAAASYDEIVRAIDRGSILFGLAIPSDYSRLLDSGRTAPVQVLLDGSDSNTASIALGYAGTVVRDYSRGLSAQAADRKGLGPRETPIDLRLRVLYNSSLESKNYIVPGLIAVILMIIAALLTSLCIAREWELGTMEQLLSTPLRPAEMVLGKMLAYFAIGLADAAISLAVGIAVFGVPFRGSLLLLAAGCCLFLFGALCWGIFISAMANSQVQAYQIGLLTSFLPSFLLSGFVYSIEGMPPVIQAVSRIVSARYFVTILKGLSLKGVGFGALWQEFAFLAVYSAAVFLLATRGLKRKIG